MRLIKGICLVLLLAGGVALQDHSLVRNSLPGIHEGQTYSFEAIANSSVVNRNDSCVLPIAYEKVIGLRVPLLLEHSWSHRAILGTVVVTGTDGKRLFIKAEFTITRDNKRALEKVIKGYSRFLSIGFLAEPINKKHPIGNTGLAYYEKPLLFDEMDLVEVSIVAVPADSTAQILSVSRQDWGLIDLIPRTLSSIKKGIEDTTSKLVDEILIMTQGL